jgi:hypothetical protein
MAVFEKAVTGKGLGRVKTRDAETEEEEDEHDHPMRGVPKRLWVSFIRVCMSRCKCAAPY